jgi:hypothetical protein
MMVDPLMPVMAPAYENQGNYNKKEEVALCHFDVLLFLGHF